MTRPRTLAVALAAGCATALFAQPASTPSPAGASQPTTAPATRATPAAVPAQQRNLAAIAAQQLARGALIDYRSFKLEQCGPADERYLARLLRDAVNLDPSNPYILRFAIEAAGRSGDQKAVLELAKALVALNPDDTSAQLALIRARVDLAQSVEERLTLLEAFLGPRGDSLDPAVRSRLAIDAAHLCSETGNATGFVKNLTAAISFDSSNPDAAVLALDYYSSRVKNAEGRFELLANTLLAAPLDAQAHATIAAELGAAGAADQAIRFYDNAFALYRRQGEPANLHEALTRQTQAASRLVQLWKTQGPAVVIKQLNDAVDVPRRTAQLDIDSATAMGKPTEQLPKPNDIRNPIDFERIRLAAAAAAGDRSTIDRSLADFGASIEAMNKNSPGYGSAMAEAAYLRALLNSGDPNADLAALRGIQGVPPDAVVRSEAWAKLRGRDRAAGRKLFEAMKNDPLATLALLAVDVEGIPAGDTPAARAVSDRLAALAWQNPESPVSAWAWTTYQNRNNGQSPPATAVADKFTAMGAGLPSWLDDIARNPSHLINIRGETQRAGLGQLEPSIVTVRITNNTPVPIAVGPGMTIDDRILLVPTIDLGGARAPELGGSLASEVTSLSGHLRILPRETAVFPIWAESGISGWGLQNVLSKSARSRYTIYQGFRVVDGLPRPGPFASVFEAGPLGRASLPLGDYAPVLSELATLQDSDLALSLLHTRLLLVSRDRPPTVEQAKSLVAALGDRYRKASSVERIAILMLAPTPRLSGAAIDLERVVAQIDEQDPAVIRAALFSRVDDPNSVLLAKYRNHPDPDVQAMVRVIDARIAADKPMFARAALPTSQTPPATNPPPLPAGTSAPVGASPAVAPPTEKPSIPAPSPAPSPDKPADTPKK